ncbi:MAG TPA: hypothetical protein TECP_00351 [Hyphomicrobiaceae bacterium MAG_BT-2024]
MYFILMMDVCLSQASFKTLRRTTLLSYLDLKMKYQVSLANTITLYLILKQMNFLRTFILQFKILTLLILETIAPRVFN